MRHLFGSIATVTSTLWVIPQDFPGSVASRNLDVWMAAVEAPKEGFVQRAFLMQFQVS